MRLPACTSAVPRFPKDKLGYRRGGPVPADLGITPALPDECRSPGASIPYTNTKCTVFVLWCQDCCRVWDPGRGPQGREVCGWWYPCGACWGWKW